MHTPREIRTADQRDHGELARLYAEAGYQRQGIGARLLAACQPSLEQAETFCPPYAHLVPFHGRLGFAPVHSAALPEFLARRLASYLAQGQDVLAMHRPAPASSLRR